MAIVFIGVGSNLGDKKKNIFNAIKACSPFSELIAVSSLYKSPAWGYTSTNTFYNACFQIETYLSPKELLLALKEIEMQLGRLVKTNGSYEDRLIDLDILLFDDDEIINDNLTIPHPYMHKRKFVLVPLNEIANNVKHPRLKKSINELLVLSLNAGKLALVDE